MKKICFSILSSVVFITLVGCGSEHDNNSSDIDAISANSFGQTLPLHLWKNDDWTQTALTKLNSNNIGQSRPSDILEYCPTYDQLDSSKQMYFYSYLMSAMAKKESSFNPASKYTESFRDSKGNRVVSRGLFQISFESANQKAYQCDFSNTAQLHDPSLNIQCSANILSYWIKKDRYIGGRHNGGWKGGARYWAVLRDNGSTAFIKSNTRSFCSKFATISTVVTPNVNESNNGISNDVPNASIQVLKYKDGYNSGRTYKKSEVKNMQLMLSQLGYDIEVDGYYGNGTVAVVEEFQQDVGVEINGNSVNQGLINEMKKRLNQN